MPPAPGTIAAPVSRLATVVGAVIVKSTAPAVLPVRIAQCTGTPARRSAYTRPKARSVPLFWNVVDIGMISEPVGKLWTRLSASAAAGSGSGPAHALSVIAAEERIAKQARRWERTNGRRLIGPG
jgi:hypothetical protein